MARPRYSGKKTEIGVKIKDISQRKRQKLLGDLKLNQTIKDLLEGVADDTCTINDLMLDNDALDILNKAAINKYLNIYVTRIIRSATGAQELNNKLLDKIVKSREAIAPHEMIKLYIKLKELENESARLVSEFFKAQDAKLDLPEQDMVIIYRSLPPHLQRLLHKTVMEFVRKCPAIQRELQANLAGNPLRQENLEDQQLVEE